MSAQPIFSRIRRPQRRAPELSLAADVCLRLVAAGVWTGQSVPMRRRTPARQRRRVKGEGEKHSQHRYEQQGAGRGRLRSPDLRADGLWLFTRVAFSSTSGRPISGGSRSRGERSEPLRGGWVGSRRGCARQRRLRRSSCQIATGLTPRPGSRDVGVEVEAEVLGRVARRGRVAQVVVEARTTSP